MERCPRCRFPLPGYHRYCSHCGHRIGLKNRPRSRIAAWAIPAIILCLLAAGLWYVTPEQDPGQAPVPPARYPVPTPAEGTVANGNIEETRPADAHREKGERLARIPMGEVIIEDITGRVLTRMRAAVVAGGWVALPRSACTGGHRWRVRMADGKESVIEEGILLDSDAIGLWHIGTLPVPGPNLAAWDPGGDITWVPLEPGEAIAKPVPKQCREQGDFVHCTTFDGIDAPGIIVQKGAVVGWSFGNEPPGGFLWTGLGGTALRPELQVHDVYRLTYGDSREEALALALALTPESDAQRLAALAAAFSRKPVLPPESTPPHLRHARVTGLMGDTAARLLDRDQAQALIRAVPPEQLPTIGDVGLALQVILATEQTDGSQAALAVMSAIEDHPFMASEALRRRHRQLYGKRLSELLKSGEMAGFWQVHATATDRFPKDVSIHLHAVAAAVASGDWQTAERLLKAMSYSETWHDRVENLSRRIARMKKLTQGLVIRFPPGSSQIRTDATINGALPLRFTVDTGASLVTVPTSILDRLDVPVGRFTTRRAVNTAGGTVEALEIVIDAIEIQGQTIRNTQALVLDIPDAPGMGLLGMNFLNRFQMDLDTQNGLLHLKPR
jgi:clan AA aspartic protease (TIGR02281 family)